MKLHLHLEDRLSILRSQDQFRNWDTLDDRRCCILCEKTFSGRQIEVTPQRDGKYKLQCPTENCKSNPQQWVYPGNPLTSVRSFQDRWRALADGNEEPAGAAGAS